MRSSKKHNSYKYVLFDLDGTLADSLEIGLNAMNRIRFLFGYKKLDKRDPRLRRVSGPDFVKTILGLNPLQAILWITLLKVLVARQAHKIKLFPGVKTMLKTLRAFVKIGVVTSAQPGYTKTILKKAGLWPLSIMEANVKYLEKDVRLLKLLKQLKLKPKEVLYVGDELRDAQACERSHVDFLAVAWGKDHADIFDSVKKVGIVKAPRDILRYVHDAHIA